VGWLGVESCGVVRQGVGALAWGYGSLDTIIVVAQVYFACPRSRTAHGLTEGAIVRRVVRARRISWSPLSGATIAPRVGNTWKVNGWRVSRCLRQGARSPADVPGTGGLMLAQSRRQLKTEALLAERAYALRTNPTNSEHTLWQALRCNRLGVAFRRQVPVGGKYIADFMAPSLKLIIEVDGGSHNQRKTADARRDRNLRRLGYRVLHLEAEVVSRQPSLAIEAVRRALAET